jgi:hypothetical protein
MTEMESDFCMSVRLYAQNTPRTAEIFLSKFDVGDLFENLSNHLSVGFYGKTL